MTPEEKQYHDFIGALREGQRMDVALTYAGLTRTDLVVLRQNPQLRREIEQASIEKEMAVVAALRRSAVDGNTDAARWLLERENTTAYMSEKDRQALRLTKDKWKVEKRIINAELEADPAKAQDLLSGGGGKKLSVRAKAIPKAGEAEEE